MLVSCVVDIGSESAGLISRTEHINSLSTMNVHGKLSLSPQTKTLQVFGGKLIITVYGMCSFRCATCPRVRFSCAMARAAADISVE